MSTFHRLMLMLKVTYAEKEDIPYELSKKDHVFPTSSVAHPDFARNRVASADAACRKLKLQAQVVTILNSCTTGATKSSEKWIKDWRSDVKAKAGKIRRAQQQTGGGPGPAPLSAMEESLMAFIGHEAAEGLAVADTLEIVQSPASQDLGDSEGNLDENATENLQLPTAGTSSPTDPKPFGGPVTQRRCKNPIELQEAEKSRKKLCQHLQSFANERSTRRRLRPIRKKIGKQTKKTK
ncbi:unnamed protein product [Parnassius apollo]|uniref:(apollo) hypothetical protein n=1 Tax=Parnassius apollo TaxID=110799 RepID=A0A8S3XPH9_PARAO|nr:unnamed protein product [Parnassius apollo]